MIYHLRVLLNVSTLILLISVVLATSPQDCAHKKNSIFTKLPVTGKPWQVGNSVWNTWLAEYVKRFSTTKNGTNLKLRFAKRNVTLESGARFVSSPRSVLPSEELTFKYQVFFKKGFNFVISGKLPGIYLGTYQEGYSTGKNYTYGQGSLRPTWHARRNTKKAIVTAYMYGAHGGNSKTRQAQGPKTSAVISGGKTAGLHLWMDGDSTLPLKPGWNHIEIALKLNTPGMADGKVRLRVNERTNTLNDVSLRDTAETKVQSIAMECFFGGSSKDHMTPGYRQTTKFKNIKLRPRYE